jgi:hypothetical protein
MAGAIFAHSGRGPWSNWPWLGLTRRGGDAGGPPANEPAPNAFAFVRMAPSGMARRSQTRQTPGAHTMDHSGRKFMFDTKGRAHLFSSCGTEASGMAADIDTWLKGGRACYCAAGTP